jgi:MYXO-CTERM domain-containing protein
VTEGTKTLNITLSSVQAEADPGNNTASATVNVGTPAQAESGGGSAGVWLLTILGLLAIGRRRFD